MVFEHAKSSGNVCPRVVPSADEAEEPPLAATATPRTRTAAHAAAAVQRTVRPLFRVGREDALFRGASPCPNSSADSGAAAASPMSANARRSRLSSSSVGRVIVDHLRLAELCAQGTYGRMQSAGAASAVVGGPAGRRVRRLLREQGFVACPPAPWRGVSPSGRRGAPADRRPVSPVRCRSPATREATTTLQADGLRTAARPGPACCSSSFSRTSCTPSSRWSQGNASQGQDRPHARNVNAVARPIASLCGIGGSGHRRRRTLSGTGRGRPLMNRPF